MVLSGKMRMCFTQISSLNPLFTIHKEFKEEICDRLLYVSD